MCILALGVPVFSFVAHKFIMLKSACLSAAIFWVALSNAYQQHEYDIQGASPDFHRRIRTQPSQGVDERHIGLTTGSSEPANIIHSQSIPMRPVGAEERKKLRSRLRRKGLVADAGDATSRVNQKLHHHHDHDPEHPHNKHARESMDRISESFSEDLSTRDYSPSKAASFHLDEEEHRQAIEDHTAIPEHIRTQHPHGERFVRRQRISASINNNELTHREQIKEMIKERRHYYPVAMPAGSLVNPKYWETFVCSACTVLCREFEAALVGHTASHHHTTLIEDAETNVTDLYRWDGGRHVLFKVDGDRYSRLSKDDVAIRKELKHLYHNFLVNDYDREAYFAAFYDAAIHQRPLMIYEGFMHDHFCVNHKEVCPRPSKYTGERFANLNNRFQATLHRREQALLASRDYMQSILEERELEREINEEETARTRNDELANGIAQPHEHDPQVMYDADGNVVNPIHQYRFPKRYHAHREPHKAQLESDALLREEMDELLAQRAEAEFKRQGEILGEL